MDIRSAFLECAARKFAKPGRVDDEKWIVLSTHLCSAKVIEAFTVPGAALFGTKSSEPSALFQYNILLGRRLLIDASFNDQRGETR